MVTIGFESFPTPTWNETLFGYRVFRNAINVCIKMKSLCTGVSSKSNENMQRRIEKGHKRQRPTIL